MNSTSLYEFLDEINRIDISDDISLGYLLESNEDNKKKVKKELSDKRERINVVRQKLQACVMKDIFSVSDSNKLFNALNEYDDSLDKIIKSDNPSMDDFNKLQNNMLEKLSYVRKLENELFKKYLDKMTDEYLNGKVDLKTIMDIVNNSNMTKDEINSYIDMLDNENKNNNSTSVNNNTEQQAVEEDKGLSNNETSATSQQEQVVEEYDEPTFTEEQVVSFENEINNLEYNPEENLAETIREMSNENELNLIDADIAEIESRRDEKGNLSFADAVRLYNLIEKRTTYEEMEIKNSFRQNKREEKLQNNNEKQENLYDRLDSIKNTDKKSYLGRLISNHMEKRLDNKIAKLKEKQAKLVNKQKLSTLTSLKIQKKRINRLAALKTFGHGIANIPGQVKNTFIDIKHLMSKPEKLQELRRSQIVMTSNPQTVSVDLSEVLSTARSM